MRTVSVSQLAAAMADELEADHIEAEAVLWRMRQELELESFASLGEQWEAF